MAADVAQTVTHTGDGSGTITVAKPGSFAAGQILVCVVKDTGTVLANLTAEADWDQEGSYSAGNSQGKVWSHAFDAGDPADWDFGYNSGETAVAMLFRVTGADLTPLIVVADSEIVSNAASEDSPSVVPNGINDLLIVTLGISGALNALAATDPGGMTDRGQVQVLDLFMAMAAASEQLASGSATGVRTWTSISPTGKVGGAFSIALASSAGEVNAASALTVTAGIASTAALELPATAAVAVVGAIAATAQVESVSSAAVALSATITATASVVGQGSSGGGWQSYLNIAAEAAAIAQLERARVPVACPNDGEPLQQAGDGILHCPYDGWQYPRDWIF